MTVNEKNYGDPTAGSTAYIALVGVLIFVLTLIYLEALYYSSADDFRRERVVERTYSDLDRVRSDQRAALDGFNYVHDFTGDRGRVTIPIADAVDRLLEEWPNPNIRGARMQGQQGSANAGMSAIDAGSSGDAEAGAKGRSTS